MAFNILHVLSSNFFSGSVAYTIQIAKQQLSEGHNVLIATDSYIPDIKCFEVPISNRSIKNRILNVKEIKKIVSQERIDIVHAHSRAASWISYFALGNSDIPFISTIHGRQVINSSLLKQDIYGCRVIAICSNLFTHLNKEMEFNDDRISIIPNGIDMETITKTKRNVFRSKEFVISLIGRFNGPKGELYADFLINVFPALLEKYPDLKIQMFGAEWNAFPEAGKNVLKILNAEYNQRIRFFGFAKNVNEIMVNSDLVIGSGRVAIEALLLGAPVFAAGEALSHGIISSINIDDAIASNFGDILPQKSTVKINIKETIQEFNSFIEKRSDSCYDFSDKLQPYCRRKVNENILTIYKNAIFEKVCKKHIPILMYHRVPKDYIDSKHQTFVPLANFKKHLKFFKLMGLTSITFAEYLDFNNGRKPLSSFPKKPFIITFDDGYADNHDNMLPLMEKYGFKGVLFPIGDPKISTNIWDEKEINGSGRLMNVDQLKAFKEAGWEIGAHTMTHPDLTKLSDEKICYEITESKKQLENNLNIKISVLAYPFGCTDKRVKNITKNAGFSLGISTDSGGLTIEDDRFEVFRVNMFPNENIFQLFKKTSSWYRKYYRRKRGK
jgi:peptidoglycan/xylan/chitin deacetylase (PgdA/CDA1 family)/glycosyltransferase involved in cell wall biosynthesis